MDPTPTWLERTLAAFPRATEARTRALLTALAVHARENCLDEPEIAYNVFVEKILQQDGVDEELVIDTAAVAWELAASKAIFVALDLEARTTLDHTVGYTTDSPLDTTIDACHLNTGRGREAVVVPSRAKRVYEALLALCRRHGLPYHCVSVMTLPRMSGRG